MMNSAIRSWLNHPGKILLMKLNPKNLGVFMALGTPMAFMVGSHIRWEPDFKSRMRMGMKQLGFWGGMLGSVVMLHRQYIFKRGMSLQQGWPLLALASMFPIAGYYGMRWLAKQLFPKQKAQGVIQAVAPMPAKPLDMPLLDVMSPSPIGYTGLSQPTFYPSMSMQMPVMYLPPRMQPYPRVWPGY